MSWFDLIKLDYNPDSEANLPREIYDSLERLDDIENKYFSDRDDIDYEIYEICDKLLDFVKNDARLQSEPQERDALLEIVREHQKKSVSDRHFETLYFYFIETYDDLKDKEEEDDDDFSPKYGSKNRKAVEAMESFKDQYYENPYSDYKENRELTSFIAGVSNGEPISDLERKFPGAYIVFDSAGLLNEVEE